VFKNVQCGGIRRSRKAVINRCGQIFPVALPTRLSKGKTELALPKGHRKKGRGQGSVGEEKSGGRTGQERGSLEYVKGPAENIGERRLRKDRRNSFPLKGDRWNKKKKGLYEKNRQNNEQKKTKKRRPDDFTGHHGQSQGSQQN